MQRFRNINSEVRVPDRVVSSAFDRAGWLPSRFIGMQWLLVNEDVMDKLYPPDRRYLPPEAVQALRRDAMLAAEEGTPEALERFLAKLEDRRVSPKGSLRTYVAVGLFKVLGTRDVALLEGYSAALEAAPAIIVCPERVQRISEEIGAGFDLVFCAVLHHEMAHAFIHKAAGGKPGRKPGEQVVEEGLANALAWSFLPDESSQAHFRNLVERQPLEYQTFGFALERREYWGGILFILRAFAEKYVGPVYPSPLILVPLRFRRVFFRLPD